MSKQTSVNLIFEKFNLLSDADFKSWMMNNHDELFSMEKEQICNAVNQHYVIPENYYKKTYGGCK